MNYYRRYLGDYMRDTMHLSLSQHGAYNLLLDVYYATESPLPADTDALFRMCRAMTQEEKAAVSVVADLFFKVGEDGLRHNLRADREIQVAQATVKKQRDSGVESANKRWSTDRSTHKSTNGSTGRSAIQPPTTNHQEESKTFRASRSDGLNGAFTAFWESYPRKKSKGQAEKAWLKLRPGEQLTAEILAGVERAKTSDDWRREGGQFIPYPATWLNAKGWEDGGTTSATIRTDL